GARPLHLHRRPRGLADRRSLLLLHGHRGGRGRRCGRAGPGSGRDRRSRGQPRAGAGDGPARAGRRPRAGRRVRQQRRQELERVHPLPGAVRHRAAGRVVLPRGPVRRVARAVRRAHRPAAGPGWSGRGRGRRRGRRFRGSRRPDRRAGEQDRRGPLGRVDRRDADKTYNPVTWAELPELAPGFPWHDWAREIGGTEETFGRLVAMQPDFLTAVAELWSSEPLETWKAWLRCRGLRYRAAVLHSAMVDEDFAFYGTA